MIEIRIHGRGGQGAVVASRALAAAAFRAGWYVQSYPDFGVERRGAPVVAFARIAEPGDVHFVRQDITEPHHVLILDSTLLTAAAVIGGLRPGGWVVVNTPDPPDRLGLPSACRVASVDASAIALEHGLGTPAQPVVNTAILGAFARAAGVIELEHLLAAIRAEVPVKADENVAAAVAAYEGVVVGVAA